MPASTAEVKDVLTIFFRLVEWKSIATIDLNKTIVGRVSNEEAAAIIEVVNIVNASTYYYAALLLNPQLHMNDRSDSHTVIA